MKRFYQVAFAMIVALLARGIGSGEVSSPIFIILIAAAIGAVLGAIATLAYLAERSDLTVGSTIALVTFAFAGVILGGDTGKHIIGGIVGGALVAGIALIAALGLQED